jgi:hypothetical protein
MANDQFKHPTMIVGALEKAGAKRKLAKDSERAKEAKNVKMYTPSEKPLVSVEKNGTVGFVKDIAPDFDAYVRPRVSITVDPLGSATGPSFGDFGLGLSAADLDAKFQNREEFAAKVVEAAKAHGLW